MKRCPNLFPSIAWLGILICGVSFGQQPLPTHAESLAKWREMRFGMFIHWGPVSLAGTEIGWSRGREIPEAEYDRLYLRFNPVRFDAEEWVRTARDAGMKYLVITSKHHDGFALWDSKVSGYDIMASPFGRDVLRELSAACRKYGIRFSTYRVDKGRRGMEGITISDEFAGDYDTPEQEVGKFNTERPWETCMTIGEQWSWKPNDELKSTTQSIRTLLQVVGGDGNFLFNVGPMPDGRIEPRQAERLREIGAWLEEFGEGVYGTRGGPIPPGEWGASTSKGKYIYLYVWNWGPDGRLDLPAASATVAGYDVLSDAPMEVAISDRAISILRGRGAPEEIASVVRLTLE